MFGPTSTPCPLRAQECGQQGLWTSESLLFCLLGCLLQEVLRELAVELLNLISKAWGHVGTDKKLFWESMFAHFL